VKDWAFSGRNEDHYQRFLEAGQSGKRLDGNS